MVNPVIASLAVAGALSPAIAYMVTRGLLPGGFVKKELVKGLGSIRAVHIYKNSLVLEKDRGRYVGVAFVDLGDALFKGDYRSLEGLHFRSRTLGRILSSSAARVELRFHVVPVSLDKVERRLERELEAIRAVIQANGPREELVDRERRISAILEKIKKGENASWFTAYIVVYAEGGSVEDAAEKALKEARSIASSLNISLGARAYVCSSRQVREAMRSLFLGPPSTRAELRTSADPLATPLPPVEKETLSPRGVFLGYRRGTRIPFMYDLRKLGLRHILVVGPTGKGKTTLLATLANRAHARGIAPLLIVDPKGDLELMLSKSIKRVYVSLSTIVKPIGDTYDEKPLLELEVGLKTKLLIKSNVENTLTRLSDVHGSSGSIILSLSNLTDEGRSMVIGSLMKSLVEWLYTSEPSSKLRKVVMIDEAWRTSEASIYYAGRIVRESRSFGVSLVLSTQSIEDLPKELLSNIATVFVFGGMEQKYVESASWLLNLSVDEAREALSTLGVGQALVKIPDNPSPIEIDIDPDTAN